MFIEEEGSCKLFGDFGVVVQVILGAISFLILIVKRVLEHPKRSWKVWALDASKQAFSALLAHFMNVTLALILSVHNDDDACVWYLINIVLDTTIGIVICYFILKLIERFGRKLKIKALKSGCYHRQDESGAMKIDYKIWTTQFVVWGLVVSFSKLILFGFQTGTAKYLEQIGNFVLSGIEDPDLELVVVMVFVPLVMNMCQFWIQDNFLKEKKKAPIDDVLELEDSKNKKEIAFELKRGSDPLEDEIQNEKVTKDHDIERNKEINIKEI